MKAIISTKDHNLSTLMTNIEQVIKLTEERKILWYKVEDVRRIWRSDYMVYEAAGLKLKCEETKHPDYPLSIWWYSLTLYDRIIDLKQNELKALYEAIVNSENDVNDLLAEFIKEHSTGLPNTPPETIKH